MIDRLAPGARRRVATAPDGAEIEEVALAAGGLAMRVLTFGAAIRDLRLDGVDRPLALGFADPEDYLRDAGHVGVVAGRCANRIAQGRFTLDGAERALERNHGAHHLHGGAQGFGRRLWRIEAATAETVALSLVSNDGEAGYPGRVRARCVYRLLRPATLRVELTAETNAPTLMNLAQHAYFALQDGPDARVCALHVAADAYTPTDAELIPTGDVAPVAGTPFDFRAARPLADAGAPLDVNLVLSRTRAAAPRFAARLSAPDGLAMELRTTEPGLQLYDGAHLGRAEGVGGRALGPHAGVCLEPQCWPDAINHPGFPSPILRPRETYRQITELRFAPPTPGRAAPGAPGP
ncbi:MAG: aldose epimerase family protein [Rubrimonas sp.]|uniref:aldose epimerase family protein n=1 Tax=Rubrimonas sp. TaxID=2036015 RepID=UPI002FDD0C2E